MKPAEHKATLAILTALLFTLAGGAPAADRFARPDAKHTVRVKKSVFVPMRDGVRLSTDLYFPEGVEGPLAVVLIRTPYNKKAFRKDDSEAHFFAGQGFVVAVQDKRGRYESEGLYTVSGGDGPDGYDTVDWVAKQSWSNGKVGTYGCSYLGDVQIFQAPERHPNLAAMIPQASGSSIGSAGGRYRYFAVFNGGTFELAAGAGWFLNAGSKVFFQRPEHLSDEEFAKLADFFDPAPKNPKYNESELWWTLPLIDLSKRAGAPPNDWENVLGRDLTDPWWDQFDYLEDQDKIDVPALFTNSWYDFGPGESLYQFNLFKRNAVSERARDNQFIILSPTTHCQSEAATEDTKAGDRHLGDARFEHWNIYVRWFDHWLNGIDNGVTQMPKVQYYVMGREEWRGADRWPIPEAKFTKYYHDSGGDANSRAGSGTLSTEQPEGEPADKFVYDPATPVPSLGGPICCTKTPEASDGSFDQSQLEMRQDVLVYTTPPLKKGVEVTGPLEAVLYVSSTAGDTDFTAKLVDVYPDGRAFNVQEGILRARYREGIAKKVWMEPGKVYEVRIDLQATSNFFGPGHRIRLEVSSSNFPRFDRNLNTGGNNYDETDWVVAANTVHHSGEHASHILLPVVSPEVVP
jgi:hypothetical protein